LIVILKTKQYHHHIQEVESATPTLDTDFEHKSDSEWRSASTFLTVLVPLVVTGVAGVALPPNEATWARAMALHSVTNRWNLAASNPTDSRKKCIEIVYEIWQKQCKKLVDFKRKNGHYMLPNKYEQDNKVSRDVGW
jgi:hypothetical protein